MADISAFGYGSAFAEDSFIRFKNNLQSAAVADKVMIHRGLTQAVAKSWATPIAILFIDAGHDYADVKRDLELWTPHLLVDGLLMMHDVLGDQFFGVTRAARELLSTGWRVQASAGSIVSFTRK